MSHGDVAAAASVVRSNASASARGQAHMLLSAAAADDAARGQHALLAAPLLEEAGASEDALASLWTAFRTDPRPGHAADGLRRLLVAARNADGIRELYAALGASNAAGLGDALEDAGDPAGAIAAWRDQFGSAASKLPWSVRLEHALGVQGEWKQVFELLQARVADATPETRAEIAAQSRWLLAEKLAETDEAWDFYRQLHAASPEDTEVLEALARIAGARGETALAVQYLDGLAGRAQAPRDAARYSRRTAEALELAGDTDGARAALTRALDALPDDQEALAGLRRLAEVAGDWQGVVGVLARQAALSAGRAQVDRFAEIARLWEDKLTDRAVAADAWRKVLDLAPDDAAFQARAAASAVPHRAPAHTRHTRTPLPSHLRHRRIRPLRPPLMPQ
jgi:tetratricopeptide (TPR) repeat protein